METTHRLTYSVARVIDITTWQSVDTICLCWLTHSVCVSHWTPTSSHSSAMKMARARVPICSTGASYLARYIWITLRCQFRRFLAYPSAVRLDVPQFVTFWFSVIIVIVMGYALDMILFEFIWTFPKWLRSAQNTFMKSSFDNCHTSWVADLADGDPPFAFTTTFFPLTTMSVLGAWSLENVLCC